MPRLSVLTPCSSDSTQKALSNRRRARFWPAFLVFLGLALGAVQAHATSFVDEIDAAAENDIIGPGVALDQFTRTLAGVTFVYTFTEDFGGGRFDHQEGGGFNGSYAIEVESNEPAPGTKKVTITRQDNAPFVFTSIFLNNDENTSGIGGEPATVGGYLNGDLVGSTQSVPNLTSGTYNFGNIVVDEVRLTSEDFFWFSVDRFAGNTEVPGTPPTDINLSSTSVNQSGGVNAVVGTLETEDPDTEASHSYSLVAGTGDTNNGSFNISGDNLRVNDASALPAGGYSVRIRTDDGTNTFDKAFTITVVDDIPPTVTSVIVPADGTYSTGQNLDFTVNASENITVDTGTGTPRIALTIGATTRYASYLSGSGTSAVVFRYTVQAGDSDNDGIALAATLDPDGGTLRDSAGNDLNTTLNSVGSTTNVLVDAVAPTVSSVSVPSNGTYSTGQNLDFTVNTSKNVTVNTGGGTPRIALTVGAETRYATYLSGTGTSAVVFRYTVQAGDNDSDGIALAAALDPDGGTIRDNAGNDLNTALNAIGDTSGVLMDTALPTITAGNINISGATGNNGAYRIGDTVTATWNNTAGGENNNLAISEVSVDFSEFDGGGAVMATNDNDTWTATYDIVAGSIDATNRNVSVSATNANGTTTVADTTNATVDNIAPTVTDANISISGASGTGGAYIIGDTVTATWNNSAGGDNNSDTSSVTVDFAEFGGGSAIAATEDAGTWTASFELVTDTVDASDRNVSITVTDDAGNSNTTADTTNATVDTIAPTVSVANITLSGATGTNGAFIIGDTVTATWNDSARGDDNGDTSSVTIDFSQFGGSAIAATNDAGVWTATFDLGAGAIDAADRNISVTATDNAGNPTTTAGDHSVPVNTIAPQVSAGNIALNGASGTGGIFIAGDTLTVTWDNTGAGDNNSQPITSVTVDFSAFGGGSAVAASASGDEWSASFALDSGLEADNLNASVTAVTEVGNPTTTASTSNVSVDTQVPDAPGVSFDQSPISSVNADNISLTLSAAETDTTANYSISSDGGGTPVTGSADITDPGQTLSGIDVSGLPDGTLTVSLTLTDAAGNASNAATATVTKDANPAEVLSVSLTDGDYTEGDQLFISIELNKDVTVTGTDATLAIDIGPNTRSAEFVSEVNGLLSFRYTVQDGDNTDANGVTVLASGITLNTTTIEDSASNAADLSFAQQSFANVQVDTIAPDEPVVTTPAEALSVNTDTFEVAGTLSEDEVTVLLYADTNQDGLPDDPSDPLDSALVTGSLWSIEHTLLQNTDNPLVVVAQDAAGNRSAPVAVPAITHDNVAPTAPENLVLDPDSDSGASDSDGITNITELLITGTADAGSTVVLTSDLDGEVGSATVDSEGDWAITTDTLNDGEHQLTATAADAAGNISEASAALTVNVDTEAPVFSTIADQHISLAHGSDVIGFTLTDNLSESSALELEIETSDEAILPRAGIDLQNGGDDRSMLLMGATPGLSTVTLTATDPAGNSDSISFDVLVNSPPVIGGEPTTSATQGQAYSFQPSASDPDGGTLMFAISNAPSWAGFDPQTGLLSGTPTEASTHHDIVISVSDGLDSVALAAFSIDVEEANNPPEISGNPPLEAMVSEPYSFVPNASDPDGDELTFSAQGLPSWLSLNPETGALTGTPGTSDEGSSATITLSVSDGELSASLEPFTLRVVAFEDLEPPELNAPADRIIDARTLFTRITLAQLLGLPADANPQQRADALAQLTTDNVDGDGCCSPMAVGFEEGQRRLRPGRHEILWRATDAAGNETEAAQIVYLRPTVSLSKDQVAVAGSEVTMRVILNGPSPFYPLEVPYTIDAETTANEEEHDLSDGTVTFSEDETEKTVTIRLDETMAVGGSTLVVRLDDRDDRTLDEAYTGAPPELYALNTSAANRHRVLIFEGNVAPKASLRLSQEGRDASLIAPHQGTVNIRTRVVDPNVGDSHSFDWSGSDNRLTALADDLTGGTMTFDPSDLSPGRYTAQVTVTDSAGETGRARLSFRVVSTLPELDPNQDSNDNGIDDQTEGLGDRNNNGIPDYLDAMPSVNVLPHTIDRSDAYLLECDPGVLCRIGNRALMSESGGVQLLDEDFEQLDDLPQDDGYQPMGGVFDFEIHDLLERGQNVRVVVPQRAAIPQDAVYRKLVNGQWQPFVENTHNSLHSAPGEEGYCPAPGDDAWEPGLVEGYWCVQLTLEDGGPNDADGEADGSISDPGAVSRRLEDDPEPEEPEPEEPEPQDPPTEEPPEDEQEPIEEVTLSSSSSGSGHSGLWLWLLLLGAGAQRAVIAARAGIGFRRFGKTRRKLHNRANTKGERS